LSHCEFVGITKVGVYTFSAFCSTLGGLVFALYTSSGNASAGAGLELDAIAAVVIGGTLLSEVSDMSPGPSSAC
jgi:simple sugar transport system permease protein